MTTYSYTIALDDSEIIALEAALDLLLERCDKELASGPCAPYWAWRESAIQIKSRLHDHARQTSGSSSDPETGEFSIWISPTGQQRPENKD